MSRAIASQSAMVKEAVPDELHDPWVEVMGDLKGKVENVKLLDLDLTDSVLFPQMHANVFWEMALDGIGGMQFVPKEDFINLFNSTIMNVTHDFGHHDDVLMMVYFRLFIRTFS
jgi:hypothetical protein